MRCAHNSIRWIHSLVLHLFESKIYFSCVCVIRDSSRANTSDQFLVYLTLEPKTCKTLIYVLPKICITEVNTKCITFRTNEYDVGVAHRCRHPSFAPFEFRRFLQLPYLLGNDGNCGPAVITNFFITFMSFLFFFFEKKNLDWDGRMQRNSRSDTDFIMLYPPFLRFSPWKERGKN